MSRVIKFRIFDTRSGCYLTGVTHDNIHSTDDLNKLNEALIWEQFTGIQDSQGRDIYEGDIVEWSYFEDSDRRHGPVKWAEYSDDEYVGHLDCWLVGEIDEPLSSLIKDAGHLYGYAGDVAPGSVRVIGNIHENADPLKL